MLSLLFRCLLVGIFGFSSLCLPAIIFTTPGLGKSPVNLCRAALWSASYPKIKNVLPAFPEGNLDTDAFNRAILENPRDLLPYRVYADWRDEQCYGNDPFAGYLRLYIESADLLQLGDKPTKAVCRRLARVQLEATWLLRRYSADWFPEFNRSFKDSHAEIIMDGPFVSAIRMHEPTESLARALFPFVQKNAGIREINFNYGFYVEGVSAVRTVDHWMTAQISRNELLEYFSRPKPKESFEEFVQLRSEEHERISYEPRTRD